MKPLVLFMTALAGTAMAGELAGPKLLGASSRTDGSEIFAADPGSGDALNLSLSPASTERYPAWSPDGKYVSFNPDRNGTFNLFVAGAGVGGVRQLTREKAPIVTGMQSWTPDGRILLADQAGDGLEIFEIDPEGKHAAQLTRPGLASTSRAASPHGRWMTFRACGEVYRRDAPTSVRTDKERRTDKRPARVMRRNGANARVLEALRFQITIDGSRASWKPEP